jgi:hypothetical protein
MTGSLESDGEGEADREIGQLEVLGPRGRGELNCVESKTETVRQRKRGESVDAKMENASMQQGINSSTQT